MLHESSRSPHSGASPNGSATLIARLIESGTPAALVAEVAVLAARSESAEQLLLARRANEAARKARQRAQVAQCPGTARDGAGQKEVPPHPPKKNNSPLTPAKAGSPRSRGVQASRLCDDFVVPEEWLGWAMAQGGWGRADAEEEARQFCNYWQARADAGARRRCWRRVWENWVRNSRRPKGEVRPAAAAAPAFASNAEWNGFCDRQAASARSIGRERQAVEWEQRKRPMAGGRA